MKKIILDFDPDTIPFSKVTDDEPIFVKNTEGSLIGMIVKEDKGWIIRTGYDTGYSGYWKTLEQLIENNPSLEFFIED